MKLKYPSILILLLAIFIFNSFSQNNIPEINPGESLEYVIFFGPINGGIATMDLKKVKYNGQISYYCETVARSTGITDVIYRVKDIYASYFDPETMLPHKSIRDINEGKYHKYDEAWYFHDVGKVKSVHKGIIDSLPPDIRDMVSTFFYIRTYNYDSLEYGDIIKINTFFDDELFPFDMRYRGRETVKTKLGKFNCIKLVPFVEPGRIFKTEEDMTIWICPDLKNAPVRVKFDLKVGSLKIDLIDHKGLELL